MTTAVLILLGISILVGIWYNGRSYSDAKHEAEAAKADAQLGTQRVEALEEQRATEAADRKAKDEHDAAEAAATPDASDGLDFLRESFKARR